MESLTWVSHPAGERPVATVFVSVLIAIILAAVYFAMERSVTMTIIAGFIFLISLSSFYFPTTYAVDDSRVRIRYLFSAKERNTSAFRKCYPGSRGILLSPYLSPSRLENFRGFYLRYGKGNKLVVDEVVRRLVESRHSQTAVDAREVKPDAV